MDTVGINDLTATMRNLDISNETVMGICNSNDAELKSHILFYKELSEEAINILKKDRHVSVKKAYAWTYATKEDLDVLILHSNNQVRWRASANVNITEEQLFTLIKQNDFIVNRNIASNIAMPESILKELSKSTDEEISILAKANLENKESQRKCIEDIDYELEM